MSDRIGGGLVITSRRLPHWQIGGCAYFVTFRLKESPYARETPSRHRGSGGAGFQPAGADGESARRGDLLSREERASVRQSILFWQGRKWTVHALTAMPDHVHVLATPLEASSGRWFSLSGLLRSVKRHGAREINRRRGRTGALWQPEAYDRIIRDADEFDEKAQYILNNAVIRGLVQDAWEYDGFWCEGVQSDVRALPGQDTAGREPARLDRPANAGQGRLKTCPTDRI